MAEFGSAKKTQTPELREMKPNHVAVFAFLLSRGTPLSLQILEKRGYFFA